MHLKSIEMVGFKSFADRTFIELKPGISGIVGPNGCGKSNIVDALRWCLGEMSAKSLRSKHMLDVIFNGASGRAPLSLAEVTLTFDNTHKVLPLDFSEIQVTRRLYRSGESEYQLNRTQCRLKDIRDLFLDTGLHEGYSILAQGEVDFVMNAKPEERRELFEEAAGISKYKVRREEALRKLGKLEIDLNRLNDLISVVKEQMDSLEAAARKAKQFQKVKEDLRAMEISDSLHRVNQFDEAASKARKRTEELKVEFEKSTTSLDSAEVQLTQYHLDQDKSEKDLYEKNLLILDLDKSINASDNLVRSEKEREMELVEQVLRLNEKSSELKKEKAGLETRLETIRKDKVSADERYIELQSTFNGAKSVWETLHSQRKDLEHKKSEISKGIFSLNSDSTAITNELNTLVARKIHKESEAAASSREIEKAQQESVQILQQIDELTTRKNHVSRSKEATKREFDVAKNEQSETQEKEENLRNQIQSLRIAHAHTQAQQQILHKKFDKDPYHKGSQGILNHGFPGLRGVVGILFKYQSHMSHWVESVLGPKINYLVFDQMDQAQEALNWIKEHEMGRARCFILDKIPNTTPPNLSSIPNANSLLTFVQCDPSIENLKRHIFGAAFLAGSMLYESGIIDGGSDLVEPDPEEKGVQSFQNEFLTLKNLEDEIAANSDLLRKLEEEFFTASANSARLKSALDDKQREMGKSVVQENYMDELVLKRKGGVRVGRAGNGHRGSVPGNSPGRAERDRRETQFMGRKT